MAQLAPQTQTQDIYTFISSQGFHFPRELVSRYLLSLQTKPFLILTGISGTGKTKLAQLVAEYFASLRTVPLPVPDRPADTADAFFMRITPATLASGLLVPTPQQVDYFNPSDQTAGRTATIRVGNVLGATGDMSIRINNRSQVSGAGSHFLTLTLPAGLRTSLQENGVTDDDYLEFKIVEEYTRFEVMLHRPEAIITDEPTDARTAFISVRPEWADPTGLLGNADVIRGTYQRTRMLELMLRADRAYRAAQDAGTPPPPYFAILDEMNLARVEHYFADFLSALESRRYADGSSQIVQTGVRLHTMPKTPAWLDDSGYEYPIPNNLSIPPNLLIIGTVNVDDTTFGISPKVLDRANVIESVNVDFSSFLGKESFSDRSTAGESPFELPAEASAGLPLGRLRLATRDAAQERSKELAPLVTINDILASGHRHFGYRVLAEAAVFVTFSMELIGADQSVIDAAIDIQILQKLVPKLAFGPRPDENMLRWLLATCVHGETIGHDASATPPHVGETMIADAKYPRSADRLLQMIELGEPTWDMAR